MYIGIVILKDKAIVSRDFYQNFLKFAIAMRLLNSDNQENNLDFIKNLLIQFVEQSKIIYGKCFISYNVHNLVHLTDDYRNYGNLNKITAFPFESFLGSNVKGSVRAGFKPLNQIAEHIERKNANIIPPHIVGPCVTIKNKKCKHNLHGNCFQKLVIDHITLRPSEFSLSDAHILLKNGNIAEIIGIHKEQNIVLIVKTYQHCNNFFESPIESSLIGIYKLSSTIQNTV